jgi:hypothetical protein
MGIFTWTFANHPERKLKYYGKGYVACPDGHFIHEACYEGYGKFDGQDIFTLLVDWNRPYLKEIFQRKTDAGLTYGIELASIAEAAMESDAAAQKYVEQLVAQDKLPERLCCGANDWKRSIGVSIGGGNQELAVLPYPIKIVSNKKAIYADLPTSMATQ